MSGGPAAHWTTESILLMTKGMTLGRRLSARGKKRLIEKIVQHQSLKYREDPAHLVDEVLNRLQGGAGQVSLVDQHETNSDFGVTTAASDSSIFDLRILRKLFGDTAPVDTNGAIQQFEAKVQEWMLLLGRYAPDAGNLDEAISAIVSRTQASDAAMKSASQESFSRLLLALSPEQIKKGVEKGPTKMGPFLKAAWFDAFEEKHGQLLAYHAKGFLARDLRDMYRRKLKNQPSE